MQLGYRLLAIGFVVVATTGLCVHYGMAYDDNWPYPDADELAEEGDVYDGESVLLIAGVTDRLKEDRFQITLTTSDSERFDIEVVGFEKQVEPGGVVQVYGPLDQGGLVQYADETVVVNENADDETYKLSLSAFAGVMAAGLFLYYWRVNLRKLQFEVRNG